MKDYCGLCGTTVLHYSVGEPIDWAKYDGDGRYGITGNSVELNQLPEKLQLRIKQKRAGIEEDAPICPKCYSRTLDEIWVAEKAFCKACSTTLEDIGYSSVLNSTGHHVVDTCLMGCPKCRLVYFIPPRQVNQVNVTLRRRRY
ncbi:MAG: hypothetical protein ABSF24_09155 [Candidatus Bathyarchaeia archaeon]|jgi:hypothetical protein